MSENKTWRSAAGVTAISLGLAAVFYGGSAVAACDRDDVAYYLKEGFSHEQITTICGGAGQSSVKPEVAPVVTKTKPAPEKQEKAAETQAVETTAAPASGVEQKLQSLILGEKVVLTDDALSYVQKICVTYESDHYYPPTQVACPKVDVVIQRNGLKVLETERVFLEGSQVVVQGEIAKKQLDMFEEKYAEELELIRAKFKNDGKIGIKVKNKAAAKELVGVLREIAR